MRKKTGTPAPPGGFRYQAGILPLNEEQDFVQRIRELPLKKFEFHGYTGKRRVLSYGWHYDFSERTLQQTKEMPSFLLTLRERAATFAKLEATDLPHALVTEYGPGAAIGWHRDKGVFEEVIGVSLLSPCNFRFRRKIDSTWEHSIPAVDALRYSITFRSIR